MGGPGAGPRWRAPVKRRPCREPAGHPGCGVRTDGPAVRPLLSCRRQWGRAGGAGAAAVADGLPPPDAPSDPRRPAGGRRKPARHGRGPVAAGARRWRRRARSPMLQGAAPPGPSGRCSPMRLWRRARPTRPRHAQPPVRGRPEVGDAGAEARRAAGDDMIGRTGQRRPGAGGHAVHGTDQRPGGPQPRHLPGAAAALRCPGARGASVAAMSPPARKARPAPVSSRAAADRCPVAPRARPAPGSGRCAGRDG